jgi:hypothetical protein
MSHKKSIARLFSWILGIAALGLVFAGAASAQVVLRGIDGGTVNGDGKFVWDKLTYSSGTCINTATKQLTSSCSTAPTYGYLYKGPDSAGKFYRTGTCWSRLTNLEVACSQASGFISSSFTHHGVTIQGGDVTISFGDIDPNEQVMTVVPGALGTRATAIIDIPDVSIKGVCNDLTKCGPDSDLGTGRFHYNVVYTIPVATSDPNKGHGNDCSKCDPDNPNKKGTSCTGCSVNQTCTNLSSTESRFTVKAFCQEGVTVDGYLTLLQGQTPPKFTNCTQETADAGNCTLKLGGLPKTSKGTVDGTACGAIFQPVTVNGQPLAFKQMLLFEQDYEGACKSATLGDFGLEKPQGAKLGLHRECNSDYGKANDFVAEYPGFLDGEGFDNTLRVCPSGTDSSGKTVYHTAQGAETAKSIEVTVDVTPESVNLKCKTDSSGLVNDNGVATATICTTPHFNVTDVDTSTLPVLFVKGDTSCAGKPCLVYAKPGGFSFAAATSGLCSGDYSQDLQITYPTCTADPSKPGLSQAIFNAGYQTDKTSVPLVLQGTSGGGTVVIQGSDAATTVLNSSF